MAFMMSIKTSSGATDYSYNVDYAVGQRACNFQQDVMLVQALLRIAYFEVRDGPKRTFDPPAGLDSIGVDGICGPNTNRFIQHYQDQSRANGQDVLCDGRFDPSREYTQLSYVSKTAYVIELLNNHCYHSCHEMGADYYTRLPYREDVPPALRYALRTCKKMARQYCY
jgi:hypothetical protein